MADLPPYYAGAYPVHPHQRPTAWVAVVRETGHGHSVWMCDHEHIGPGAPGKALDCAKAKLREIVERGKEALHAPLF